VGNQLQFDWRSKPLAQRPPRRTGRIHGDPSRGQRQANRPQSAISRSKCCEISFRSFVFTSRFTRKGEIQWRRLSSLRGEGRSVHVIQKYTNDLDYSNQCIFFDELRRNFYFHRETLSEKSKTVMVCRAPPPSIPIWLWM
jgi:hypothetical protein